tara:strand:- start:392 stop:559 length:168 start_codon:yes stop_codon:yes gene_type:complete
VKVGDLVKHKKHFGKERVGIIYAIGSPVPIAKILWAGGYLGAMNMKFLEVIHESR